MSNKIQTYLSFQIGGKPFGINVDKVIEIREYSSEQSIPEGMDYVKGLIHFREEVIPLIDPIVKFKFPAQKDVLNQVIIVIEIQSESASKAFNVGILVDAVSDVFEESEENLKTIQNDYKPGYILGSYVINEQLIYILNVNKVFASNEIIELSKLINN